MVDLSSLELKRPRYEMKLNDVYCRKILSCVMLSEELKNKFFLFFAN